MDTEKLRRTDHTVRKKELFLKQKISILPDAYMEKARSDELDTQIFYKKIEKESFIGLNKEYNKKCKNK